MHENYQYMKGNTGRLLLFIFGFTACTTDFQEINTNPNAPVDVQPGLLFRQVLWDYAEQIAYEGFVAGNLLGQYFTAIDFNLFDRHSLSEPQFGGNPWDMLYVNLRDNEIILKKSQTNPAYAVYEGPALILKACLSATLTDIFGDVPYTEAFAGKMGILTPTYDQQQAIYMETGGILDNLKQGINALERYQGPGILEGDILYNGDLQAWIRLANSLQLKYLMRISERLDVSEQVATIFEEGNFIQSNEANAAFDFASPPNNFRMSTARIGDYNIYIMSETIEAILKSLDDPRMAIFFRPTGNDPDTYRGLRNGPDASQLSITVADYSLTGRIWREEATQLDANYMTAAETYFLLAEAAQKGYLNANANALYEQAVRFSFEYWNTSLPTTYLTTGAAAFGNNGANPLEQIATQKWLHNIGNGYEGWIAYRRTGFPHLKPVTASLNNGLIPVRMPYPTSEATLNTRHYEQAALTTNGNSVNTPVWWDVN